MRKRDLQPPIVESYTRRAWDAFCRVINIRHLSGLGSLSLPDWAGIATVLQVHELWTPSIQEHLASCFNQLLKIEAEQAKAKG